MAPLTKKLHSFLRRRIFRASKQWWTEFSQHLRGKIRKLRRTKFESMSVSYSVREHTQNLSEPQDHPRTTAAIVEVANFHIFAKESDGAKTKGRDTTSTTRPRGGCSRKIQRPQFRMKLDPDSSISRSSLLISHTRSVGTFEVLFPRDNYPSTLASVLKHNSLSASGIQGDKHCFLKQDSSTRSYSKSTSSISEDIWSTTVLSPTSKILSSTPIKK